MPLGRSSGKTAKATWDLEAAGATPEGIQPPCSFFVDECHRLAAMDVARIVATTASEIRSGIVTQSTKGLFQKHTGPARALRTRTLPSGKSSLATDSLPAAPSSRLATSLP